MAAATTTTPSSPTGANAPTAAKGSADFLDLADSASQKASNQAEINARIEQKRLEHERQRAAQRALFEAQMRALEEEQLREEAALLKGVASSSLLPAGGHGGATTAPNSPPQQAGVVAPKSTQSASSRGAPSAAPGSGYKSMPASRRPSAGSKDDLSYHLSKLSMASASGNAALGGGGATRPGSAALGSGAANGGGLGGYSGKFVFDDEPSTGGSGAASEWPQFTGASTLSSGRSPLQQSASGALETQTVPLTGRSPTATLALSPRASSGVPGLDDVTSVGAGALASLSSRSVPGTPQAGFGASLGSGGGAGNGSATSNGGSSANGAGGGRSSLGGGFKSALGSPGHELGQGGGTPGGGTGEAQRGFSNPDLSKAFGRAMGNFQKGDDFGPLQDDFGVVDPNVYQSIGLGGSTRFSQYGAFSPATDFAGSAGGGRGFDKIDGLGGVKLKRADLDREAEFNRFAGTRVEDLQGEILPLCKDQHGCRYLQKKLEEGVPEHRDMIFRETYGHFADLMTDPFGNYLCQKLLEFSTDEQRNAICESVAGDLVSISLNMHGTRAVQKMIDFLSTPRQIHSIIIALSANVVPLIKDLNGNHVIQKCLNRLVPEDNQFIYNAVAAHCVEVATHRHGCCVLQRCIDHAADSQRVQLVTEITYHGLTLVQDPFGNYVVQYVLDLNDNRFSDAVTRQFIGNVCALSVQKFSSNVIEKCIRVAEPETRKILIAELLNRNRLEKLLRDSFANYVVQTALDYAEPGQRMLLVECIRPILPMIRNTPYGKRIQSKLQREHMEQHHHYGGGNGNGNGGQGGNAGGLSNGGVLGGVGGGGYNQQQALINLALGGGGMGMGMGGGGAHAPIHPHRHIGNPSLHHPRALQEAYGSPALNYQNLHHQHLPVMDHFGTAPGVGAYGGLAGVVSPGGLAGFGLGGGGADYGQQQQGVVAPGQHQQQQQGGFSYGGL